MLSPLPDVIVAGAGIIGASIAWELGRRGVRVTLLDSGRVGAEASWAGAGMLAPGGEFSEASPWLDFALESLELYPEFAASLREETGRGIDFRHLGAVEVARTPEDWAALSAHAARQRELGISSQTLGERELRGLVPLLEARVSGALYYPGDALVDPRDVTAALKAACLARRVRIEEGCPAVRIRLLPAAVEVETSHGLLSAAAAVLAAGAWSSQVPVSQEGRSCALPPAFPIRGHLAGFDLESGSLGPILRCAHTYIAQRSSGFTIAGSSVEDAGFDRALNPAVVNDIRARAGALIPALGGTPSRAWLGFRPAAEGYSPVIRRVAGSSLWLAYGHYRNGILLAPATARRIAGEITASSERDSSSTAGLP